MYTMILNHPLVELVGTSSRVCVVEDNAKSHAEKSVPQTLQTGKPCRWTSSPVLPTKPKFLPMTSLKRSSSVPTKITAVPSLTSLVAPSHVRRRSLELPPGRERLKASELLSEYLRLSTEDLSTLGLDSEEKDNDEEDDLMIATQSFGMSPPPPPPSLNPASPQSLTSNVKKPVRRKSLDGSSSTTATTAC